MDSQANDDLKRVADMAAESVAKRQCLNYDPSPYPVMSMSQNVPPPNSQYTAQKKKPLWNPCFQRQRSHPFVTAEPYCEY